MSQARGIHRAVEIAGSQRKLGQLLGVTGAAVQIWCEQGYVPASITQNGRSNRVLDVERLTGVPRHELNPAIYPPPSESCSA